MHKSVAKRRAYPSVSLWLQLHKVIRFSLSLSLCHPRKLLHKLGKTAPLPWTETPPRDVSIRCHHLSSVLQPNTTPTFKMRIFQVMTHFKKSCEPLTHPTARRTGHDTTTNVDGLEKWLRGSDRIDLLLTYLTLISPPVSGLARRETFKE